MDNLKRIVISLVAVVPAVLFAQPSSYTATWASVNQHPPAPEWFKDAKFGIYFHWGVFSVPAFANEWYPRNMYNNGSGEYNHHVATYGDPYTSWPYHNFINGANNRSGVFTQFAPRLKSNGGNFDPVEWVNLFDSAGAKFAGPVAEHHDGFSMWNSTVNEWNSVSKGPMLNLASLFAAAIRAKGMKFMMSMHHAYNFTGFYQWVPAQSNASLQKLYGQLGTTPENQLWYDKLKEIIDIYQPDLIWQDFNLTQVNETQRLNFLSYYFNKGIEWGKEVVATYKDGFNNNGEVYDYERGGPADLTFPYWLTDDAISSSSWCYTQGIGYYSTTQMLHSLIDRVSKNGNMLLNISPMADGTIPTGQRTVLLGIGDWLRRFGESIYSTRAWSVYGEGPTKAGGGAFTAPLVGTNMDFRYTRNKDSTVLYSIILGWPGNGAMSRMTTLNSKRFDVSGMTGVSLLGATAGTYIPLGYSQDTAALRVTMPSTQPYTALAYVLKLTFSSHIPPLQCPVRNPYVQMEAENFDSKYGAVQAETCGEGGQSLGYIQNGDWVSYCIVDFKNGASNFSARIATNTSTSSGRIDLRLDSATGTLVGSLTGSGPGGWQTYATRTCAVNAAAAGKHTLYLVFQAGYNVNWFSFTQLPVGVIASHPPAAVSNTTFEGKLFCRELLTMASMDLPGNAAGVDVYSLQGKRILLYRTNGRWDSGTFEAFKKQLPSGMFYMKILER
jgi:alpha-L-fucosidase